VLHTVRVPEAFEPLFATAEETVSRFFRSRKDDPEHGTIEISGERYILVRAASLSVEFFGQVEQLFGTGREADADQFARNFLFDLAHAVGKSDARNFHRKMNLVDPIAKLSAGPVHFSHTGWAFVDISPESRALPNDDYYLLFDHPYSFESDAWLRAGKSRSFPVCIMNAGWSSGWCEESFGVQLVSSEVMCRARGDETCRFIMAPPGKIESYVRHYMAARYGSERGGHYEIPDFFARKRAEEELRTLYARLKELDLLKTELFANVSHELRTPLMLISGPVERLLADARVGEPQREDLRTVQRNARILLKHVNDLLDVAKLEAGKTELRVARVDIAELTRLATSHFEALAGERGVALRTSLAGPLLADLDADKVGRVILNLLSNAFKFANGSVRVALEREGERARLEVVDDGPGVPPDLRETIFERFRQIDTGPSRRSGGTGLGLAIAKDFVELHGGRIFVDVAPGGGARFVVEVPLHASTGAAVTLEKNPPTLPEPVLVRTAKVGATFVQQAPSDAPLVLVVEDNADVSRFVATTLAPDHRIALAADGQEGLEKALSIKPDLIVTDVMMPRLSGDELVRQLREHGEADSTPILVLTAKADDDLRVRLLSGGAQDYLAKPFSPDELRARARNLLATKRARDLLQAELTTTRGDLEELAKELIEKKRALNVALDGTRAARDEAEQASAAKTMFLGLVGHELTTPLQTIRLTVDSLLRRPDGARVEKLHKIARASSRLEQMIEALLQFVRLESGRVEVERAEVDLGRIVHEVVEDLGTHATEKGLAISVTAVTPVTKTQSDAKLLRLVIANLVGNAIKYTDRGHVEVRYAQDANSQTVQVADTGHGISADHYQDIFEPFAQLEPLRHKHTPGVGLGLTLVREAVKALGGQLSLVSEVGRGSTFTVVFTQPPC
jgi:signal transduction histidine kinase